MSPSTKIIIISYLEYLISKVKNNQVTDIELNKVYNILFESMTDCSMKFEDREMLECFSLGWLVKENEKQRN